MTLYAIGEKSPKLPDEENIYLLQNKTENQ